MKDENLWEVCDSGTISIQDKVVFTGNISEIKEMFFDMICGKYWTYEHKARRSNKNLAIDFVPGGCSTKLR